MAVIIDIASCFYYINPQNGDTVKQLPVEDYVKLIGARACALVTQVNIQANALSSVAQRVLVLEQKPVPTYTLPSLYPTGIANPNVPLVLDVFTALLESEFVKERTALGMPTDIYNALLIVSNSPDLPALGTSGGKLSALTGWIPTVADLADAFNNLSLMVMDLRSSIANIKAALPSVCDRITVALQTTYSSSSLQLIFTGSIPSGLVNTVSGGSLFTITDSSGNHVTQQVDIITNINNISGVTINLSSTSIVPADDLRVTCIYSFTDPVSATICQKTFDAFVSNTVSCPAVSVTPANTSANYSFTHPGGALTYSIEVYDATNTLVQSRSVAVTSAQIVSGTFSALTAGTQYKLRLQMVTSTVTRSCPFTSFTTIPNPCPAPIGASITLTI